MTNINNIISSLITTVDSTVDTFIPKHNPSGYGNAYISGSLTVDKIYANNITTSDSVNYLSTTLTGFTPNNTVSSIITNLDNKINTAFGSESEVIISKENGITKSGVTIGNEQLEPTALSTKLATEAAVYHAINTKIINIEGINAIGVSGQSTEKSIYLTIDQNDKVLEQSINGLKVSFTLSGQSQPLSSTYSKKYFLLDKNGNIIGDTIDIQKDKSLSGVVYDDKKKELTFVYYTATGSTTSATIQLSGLIDIYNGASGITSITTTSGITFIGNIDTTTEKHNDVAFLTVGTDGFKIDGIQTAINDTIEPVSTLLISAITETSTTFNNKYLTKINPSGSGIFIFDGEINTGYNNQANGWYSHVEGINNIASGSTSHAEGQSTKSSGSASHAEGYKTQANGPRSHAEGYQSISNGSSSHSQGINTSALSDCSHAEGVDTITNSVGSHAEGHATITSGEYSHAEGYKTHADGQASHAEGNNTYATAENAHAEGTSTYAIGNFSHAEGGETKTYGQSSHAEGYKTEANGQYSHTEGTLCKTYKNFDHAEGQNTCASGYAAHAEGNNTKALNYFTHAEGENTTANARGSHVEGNYSITNSNYSHAEGIGTIASTEGQHVEGKYNVADSSKIYIIGGGTDANHRKNIHTLDLNGNAYFTGTLSAATFVLDGHTVNTTSGLVQLNENGEIPSTLINTIIININNKIDNNEIKAVASTVTAETNAKSYADSQISTLEGKAAASAATLNTKISIINTQLDGFDTTKSSVKLYVEAASSNLKTYTDSKIAGLGNVFEFKGYTLDRLSSNLPISAKVGQVWLVDEIVTYSDLSGNVSSFTDTAEYVAKTSVSTEIEILDKYEKLGVKTSLGSYATKAYVDAQDNIINRNITTSAIIAESNAKNYTDKLEGKAAASAVAASANAYNLANADLDIFKTGEFSTLSSKVDANTSALNGYTSANAVSNKFTEVDAAIKETEKGSSGVLTSFIENTYKPEQAAQNTRLTNLEEYVSGSTNGLKKQIDDNAVAAAISAAGISAIVGSSDDTAAIDGSVFARITYNKENINTINNNFNTLNNKITEVSTAVATSAATFDSNISTLSSDLNAVSSTFATSAATLNSNINSISSNMSTINTYTETTFNDVLAEHKYWQPNTINTKLSSLRISGINNDSSLVFTADTSFTYDITISPAKFVNKPFDFKPGSSYFIMCDNNVVVWTAVSAVNN